MEIDAVWKAIQKMRRDIKDCSVLFAVWKTHTWKAIYVTKNEKEYKGLQCVICGLEVFNNTVYWRTHEDEWEDRYLSCDERIIKEIIE
jgi:hypothetical protein